MHVKSGQVSSPTPSAARAPATLLRSLACLSTAALLSACAGHGPPMTATQEAATYIARAKPSYAPPGPPEDPWGPYIVQAAARYDVPERWIREVMRVESGSHQYTSSGVLITSPVGAMGLMQLMPETYDEVRARYNLGDDAFDPKNNILAGTAYLREMYDAFGSPGFLAAYNGGPARLEDYLTHNRPLPAETRRYVAMIAPTIQGSWPQARSPAEQYAVNQLPIDIPAGPRYVRHTPVRIASRSRHGHETTVRYATIDRRHMGRNASPPIELAEAPEPRIRPASHATYAAASHHGFHLIEPAMASESVSHHVGGSKWAIQVGAYGNESKAHAAVGAARSAAGHAQASVATVKSGHAILYRARFSGMTHDGAIAACHKVNHGRGSCVVVAPSA